MEYFLKLVNRLEKDGGRVQKFDYWDAVQGEKRSNTPVLQGFATPQCIQESDLWMRPI
jgi:hypothetical protein